MKILKKNQAIIYVIALMLVVAGYLNYSTTGDSKSISASATEEELVEMANIGDAQLVNSQLDNKTEENTVKQEENKEIANKDKQQNEEKENTLETNANTTPAKDEYFTKSKLERDTMYSQMIETYEKVLNSSNSLEIQRQSATEEITKINQVKNSIMICENLIRTKGFDNNIIFVNGESISIIIGIQELRQEEVAQIQHIIARELSAKIENIHIATK